MEKIFRLLFLTLALLGAFYPGDGQGVDQPEESDYYKITTVAVPDAVKLEVGGMAFNANGQLAVATRHGKIWLIDHPGSKHPEYTLFASGLHEPLGLAFYEGAYYTAQRGELTKITDTDQDGKADFFQTVYAWPLSGNYHEYSYGPLILPNDDMIVTLNLGWTHGHMESLARWRGWMLKISPEGKMVPVATGMRSPAGFGLNAQGDLFYTENQGDWIGSGWLTHIEKGDFTGHPMGLRWSHDPSSTVHGLNRNMFADSVGTMYAFNKEHPSLKLPSVWFPQGIMGISTSAVLNIAPADFGPFKDQLLIGDQGQSKIMRVALEKVKGEYQGACFPFRKGFSSGILRLAWGKNSDLYIGMTSRGWPSMGGKPYGLQRLTWTGKVPFEMKTIHATPYGFEIAFTLPVNREMAGKISSYAVTGFTYIYHSGYGSPIINKQECPVKNVEVSQDGKTVKLYVDGLRAGYIHEVKIHDLQSNSGVRLLHTFAYYTLNNIPEGYVQHRGNGHHQLSAGTDTKADVCAADELKTVTVLPPEWKNGPDKVIAIGTKPGLRFSKAKIEVKAGSHIELVFNNTDDMLHNLVIGQVGQLDKIGKPALNMGLAGPDQGYVPDIEEVLQATCLLQPGHAQSIYFTAPEKPGKYPYLCTYPGHYLSMNGIMIVTKE